MSEIFLSASVPVIGRGEYEQFSDPFLIQIAVRELVGAAIRDHSLVWGGHPAITPMIWAVCEDIGVRYETSVILYQSEFFRRTYPTENDNFSNIITVPSVRDDREASLLAMRNAMLSRPSLAAAVFVGGMDGVEEEHRIFRQYHATAPVFALGSTGGAARKLALSLADHEHKRLTSVDFAGIFLTELLPLLR